jgi:hypothetical protein
LRVLRAFPHSGRLHTESCSVAAFCFVAAAPDDDREVKH